MIYKEVTKVIKQLHQKKHITSFNKTLDTAVAAEVMRGWTEVERVDLGNGKTQVFFEHLVVIDYDSLVDLLLAKKYKAGQENAIKTKVLAGMDYKNEFAEFLQYREACLVAAREYIELLPKKKPKV